MHIPQRMCIACRTMKPKSELIKLVRLQGDVAVDEKQNMFGRGAYICKNAECIDNAHKRHMLSRQFKMQIDDAVYTKIREAAKNG